MNMARRRTAEMALPQDSLASQFLKLLNSRDLFPGISSHPPWTCSSVRTAGPPGLQRKLFSPDHIPLLSSLPQPCWTAFPYYDSGSFTFSFFLSFQLHNHVSGLFFPEPYSKRDLILGKGYRTLLQLLQSPEPFMLLTSLYGTEWPAGPGQRFPVFLGQTL